VHNENDPLDPSRCWSELVRRDLPAMRARSERTRRHCSDMARMMDRLIEGRITVLAANPAKRLI
jgi:hypothetical protein